MTIPIENRLYREIQAGITDRIAQVIIALDAVQTNPEIAATHLLSTSIRRLIVTRKFVKQLTGNNITSSQTHKHIRHIRIKLSIVRDLQIMKKKVLENFSHTKSTRLFLDYLKKLEDSSLIKLMAAINVIGFRMLEESRFESEPDSQSDQPIARVRKIITRVNKKTSSYYQPAIINENDAALHEMRVKYKALRYSLELIAPIFPEVIPANSYLKSFQQLMGEAHDWYILCKYFTANDFATTTDSNQILEPLKRLNINAHNQARSYIKSEWPILQNRLAYFS